MSADRDLTNADVRAVGPQIRMMMPSLTLRQRRILSHLITIGKAVEKETIGEVSRVTEVSPAVIVKLSKKLGFSGFRQLKAMLYAYCQLPLMEMHKEIKKDDAPEVIIEKVFHTSIHALEETLSMIDIADFKTAVEIASSAKQRDFYGLGGSAAIAKDACHRFLRIGLRCNVYEDVHMMLMSASLLTCQDMVLAISHSGRTTGILEAAKRAKASGAKVVALSSFSNSPLSKIADVCLYSTAQGSPLTGENAAARIAQLNIMDALFVCVAQRDFDRSLSDITKTMASVETMREY